MNLRELKDLVDKSIDICNKWDKKIEDTQVSIKIKNYDIRSGNSSTVSVNSAGIGFDWDDRTKFILFPDKNLTEIK